MQSQFSDSGPAELLDVVVAGAGLGGLATAEAIQRLNPHLQIRCLEANERAGGVISTVHDRGFVIEQGPAGFLNKYGAVKGLAAELGLRDQLIPSDETQRIRWIRHNGLLKRFPLNVPSFLSTDLISWRGKARMLTEPFRSRYEGEETVAAFATRRLGREAADILVAPIVSGIYAADAGQVSLQASLPHLAALEGKGRSLLASFLKASGTVRPLMTFEGGCGRIIDSLKERLGERVVCSAPIQSIRRRAGSFELHVGGPNPRVMRARAVACATPAHATSDFIKSLDSEIAFLLSQVRYASVAVVSLGYRRTDVSHPLNGFGYLVPRCEDTPVLGVQWSSSIWPDHRAPKGSCLLRLFMGGAPNPLLAHESEQVLAELATDELRARFGVKAPPLACHVKRHIEAMPQYLLQHHERTTRIEQRCQSHEGLFIGGNGLRGLGMDAVVRDAQLQAHAVTNYIRAAASAQQTETPARKNSL